MARVPTGESSLRRAIRIIEAFGVDEGALQVSEISRRTGLHMATTSRLINDLVGSGWLERDDRRVRIGMRLWEVASRASPTVTLREAAMPFMEDLHAVVGQHTQLAVREGNEVLFVERLSAPGAVVNFSRIAGRLPLHASSSGLVLLAYAATDVQERIVELPMKAFTPATITDPRRLRALLAEVRQQGYALCAGHLFPESTGVAVAIRDADGNVCASLGVIVPNDQQAFALIPALRAAGRGISRVIASSGDPQT